MYWMVVLSNSRVCLNVLDGCIVKAKGRTDFLFFRSNIIIDFLFRNVFIADALGSKRLYKKFVQKSLYLSAAVG